MYSDRRITNIFADCKRLRSRRLGLLRRAIEMKIGTEVDTTCTIDRLWSKCSKRY